MPNNSAIRAEREARREYVHYRHRLVIGFSITVLVAITIIASLILAGVVHTEDQETNLTTKANNFGITAPCPPKDAAAPAYSQITVRVLNGTTHAGLANAVNQAIQLRGVMTQDIANSTTKLDRTEIRAGKNAITQAYVVNEMFPDAILRLDDRSDALVDIILGDTFDNLAPASDVTKPGKKLPPLQGCVSAAKLKVQIKAPKHQAVALNKAAAGATASSSH